MNQQGFLPGVSFIMQRRDRAAAIWLGCIGSLLLLLSLTACKSAGGEDKGPTLTYATLSGQVNRELVEKFNIEHTGEIQIEVLDYSEGFAEGGHQGMDRLITEIAAGNCPDIIEMFTHTTNGSGKINALPYQQMAKKGYLENLWPYIENDPELGRSSVIEAPLKAAEVDGGLYMLFNRFSIRTIAGPVEVVGDRYSWTLEELQEAFARMPEGAAIMAISDKASVFHALFPLLVDSYIDWESGQCSFDSEEFRSHLEFVNSFPQEQSWTSDEAMNQEWTEKQMEGLQMLNDTGIWKASDIQKIDIWCGGQAGFVGYPTADGSVGSFFSIESERLAMSSGCKNKEAAWEFLREMLLPRYQPDEFPLFENVSGGMPVNRSDFRKHFQCEQNTEISAFIFGPYGPYYDMPRMAEAYYVRLVDFINRIDKLGIFNQKLRDTIEEPCMAYFAGDKTLDETVKLIQNRVTLYVNENI